MTESFGKREWLLFYWARAPFSGVYIPLTSRKGGTNLTRAFGYLRTEHPETKLILTEKKSVISTLSEKLI